MVTEGLIMESCIYELLCLGIDLAWFAAFYRLYTKRKKAVDELTMAPVMDINSNLKSAVTEYKNSVVPYCVIRGSVQSKSTCMKSSYVDNVTGVIKEVVLKEHKIRWNPLSRFWSETEHVIKRSINNIPFVLHNASPWRPVYVEVEDPFAAEYMTLATTYDHFTPSQQSFGDTLVGWARGENSKGFQEIETMLVEGTMITGVGQLVLEHGDLKLQPPTCDLTYFLTSMPREALIRKLWDDVKLYRVLSTLFGITGLFLVSWITKSIYSEWKQKVKKAEEDRRREEVRRLRRREVRNDNTELSENIPKCVVCLTNNIEIIVLECGHACLCADCAEGISDLCPVCRSHITRTVAAFLP